MSSRGSLQLRPLSVLICCLWMSQLFSTSVSWTSTGLKRYAIIYWLAPGFRRSLAEACQAKSLSPWLMSISINEGFFHFLESSHSCNSSSFECWGQVRIDSIRWESSLRVLIWQWVFVCYSPITKAFNIAQKDFKTNRMVGAVPQVLECLYTIEGIRSWSFSTRYLTADLGIDRETSVIQLRFRGA